MKRCIKKMKKNLKVLSTASLAAVLASSTLVPTAVAAAEDNSALVLDKVIVEKNGENLSLPVALFSDAIIEGLLSGSDLSYVQTADGTIYTNEAFSDALIETGGNLTEAFALLKEANLAVEDLKVSEGEFNDKGELVSKDGEEQPSTEIKVESVSAINGTTGKITVTFESDVTEADLKGSTLALKGAEASNKDVTAKATFEGVKENVATYAVENFRTLKDGKYSVTPSIEVANKDLATTYSAIVSTTNVEGFVFEAARNADGEFVKEDGTVTNNEEDAHRVGVEGATVTVGGESVKTDSKGYYKIPVNAGKVKVEFTKDGNYFVEEHNAEVKRNFSTVQNAELVRVDVAKLEVLGKVVDSKTGQPVEGAAVKLEKKVDGEWVELATVTTNATGAYGIGNSAATTATAKLPKNPITLDSELRTVVAKDLSAENLNDVYEAKTVDVKLSNREHTTNMLTELRPIAELNEFKMDVVWNKEEGKAATLPTAGTTKVTMKLVDSNGKDLLVGEGATSSQAAFEYDVPAEGLKENALKDAVDLVEENFFGGTTAADAVKPTLPTGKYFLIVQDDVKNEDDAEVNAIAVAAIDIKEGQNYAGKVEIEKARTLNLTANYSEIVYDESLTHRNNGDLKVINTAGNDTSGETVTPDLVVTKKVDGVDVELERKAADQAFQYTEADKSIVSQSVVEKMGLGAYNLHVENNYVLGGKATKSTEIKTDVKNETISFETASTLDVTLKTKGETNALTKEKLVGTTVELLDKSGKVVATTTIVTDEAGEVVTSDDKVATVTTTGTVQFLGIKPGDYKVRAKAVDHEQGTSKEVKVLDVQDQEATVEMEAIKTPVVQGFVKFADTFDDVEKATVMVYRDGKPVAFKEITDSSAGFKFAADESGTQPANATLEEGVEYTFVVRGEGFETASYTHKVTKGENEPVNFRVTRGGEGKAKLSVTTSDKHALPTGATITATDALYGGKNLWKLENGKWTSATATPTYSGEFEFKVANGDAKEWNVEALGTKGFMSAGDYNLAINFEYGTPKKNIEYASTITLGDINGTYYGEIEVPVDNKGVVTYNITGDITDGKTTDHIIKTTSKVVVAAFDKNNNLITSQRVTPTTPGKVDYTLTVPNGQVYSVAVYVDGTFVEAKEVTVQGFNETANFKVEEAVR